MKILKYGRFQPERVTCSGCGAVLEYTPADVKSHGNRFHTYYYVPCPVCCKWCFTKKEDRNVKD